MSADFEAAFDSLSWCFVSMVLEKYNFGPQLRKLIDILYLNSDNFSRIMLNGYLGDKIHLKCGIRQRDPASGYLFNLAVNTLAQQIKRSKLLTGIRLSPYNEVRISQYADDTVLFLKKNSRACIRGALQELKTFSDVSGLGLNVEKTSCLEIGLSNQGHVENNYGLKWASDMKILGIHFKNNTIGCPRIIRTYDFTRISSLWCNRRSSSFQTFLKYTSRVIDECCVVPRSCRGLVPSPVRLALG